MEAANATAAGAPVTATASDASRARRRRRILTWGGFAVFLVVFAVSAAIWGLPWSRDRLAIWLVAGLLAVSLADLRSWARGVIVDWSPLFVILFAYDLLRGYADGLVSAAHTWPQLRFDEVVFGGTVPTVTLQQRYLDLANPAWYDYVAWAVYTSHFFVSLAVAAVLWRVAYPQFRRFVALFVSLIAAGFVTYVLFPAVPPWLASVNGDLEPTVRIVPYMWRHVGVEPAAIIFEQGDRYYNDVAAMPSLHSAFPVLLALFFARWLGWPGRLALWGYAVAMAVTLVYAAEHYVSDILAGWLYAIVVYAVVERLWSRRAMRAASAADGRV